MFEEERNSRLSLVPPGRINHLVGKDRPQKVLLYHVVGDENDVGHLHAVVNINAFFGKAYFCPHCLKTFHVPNTDASTTAMCAAVTIVPCPEMEA